MPSFRDPAGRVLVQENRVLRVVNKQGEDELSAFLSSRVASRLFESGMFVKTARLSSGLSQLSSALNGFSVYEHELIPFTSYPYEWCAEMLHAAGTLTLDIAEQCLDEGFGLKDASPYNILFRGPDPVFVDALSFERRNQSDPTWLSHAQFMRNFLLPLLAHRDLRIRIDQIFRTRRDGIWPAELCAWAGPLRRLSPTFFSAATFPWWLSRFESDRLYRPRAMEQDQARFVLHSLFRRLRRKLRRVLPGERRSLWSPYADRTPSYTAEQSAKKKEFIDGFLSRCCPKNVLDIGCNTGVYSLMAAERGASVVAIDADVVVVGKLWLAARAQRRNVLPLVVDIARPTPALGWRNHEGSTFLQRASGAFDTVFLLAVIHHLLVTERVPLDEIVSLASDLTTRYAVIEFIGPDDPMVHRLARGSDGLYRDVSAAAFENACAAHFTIVNKSALPESSRILYLLRKR
ncbi:MAG TPA: class I SAM-dependent methyltransferase [Bryobacteraceae bacterium]|nr:class I SAM-dependent methyltransferase [Bryobacteraceae bacterium]